MSKARRRRGGPRLQEPQTADGGPQLKESVSSEFAGICCLQVVVLYTGSGDDTDPALIVEQADCALYAAKRKGRNRTEVFHLDSREEFARTDDEDARPASNLRM